MGPIVQNRVLGEIAYYWEGSSHVSDESFFFPGPKVLRRLRSCGHLQQLICDGGHPRIKLFRAICRQLFKITAPRSLSLDANQENDQRTA